MVRAFAVGGLVAPEQLASAVARETLGPMVETGETHEELDSPVAALALLAAPTVLAAGAVRKFGGVAVAVGRLAARVNWAFAFAGVRLLRFATIAVVPAVGLMHQFGFRRLHDAHFEDVGRLGLVHRSRATPQELLRGMPAGHARLTSATCTTLTRLVVWQRPSLPRTDWGTALRKSKPLSRANDHL